jgi:hypothetical protein
VTSEHPEAAVDTVRGTPTSQGDPGLSVQPSRRRVSRGTSEAVRGGRVAVSGVTPWTLQVRGDLGQPWGVARGGSGFTATGAQ